VVNKKAEVIRVYLPPIGCRDCSPGPRTSSRRCAIAGSSTRRTSPSTARTGPRYETGSGRMP